MPGVHAVLTAKEIPGDNLFGAISADQPVLAEDRVRFIGDPVALVFAETPEQASAAVERVRADYEPLPPVFSPEEALAEGAPNLHEGGNVLTHLVVETGDVEAALSGADVIVDERFRTPFVDQGFLEPEAGLASFDEQGSLTIWTGVQNPFDIRRQVAAALGMPVEKVRLINMAIGGAFGGKCDVSLQIFLALGALHTRRPVKMVFSRRDSLRFHPKRHAFEMRYRMGASRDGKLVGIDADIVGDTGAYASWGKIVLQSLAGFACGPYVVPNSRVSLKAVYTNNPPAGAWRGFGVPQAHVALESQMDALARQLGMDPFRFRELNGLEAGSVTYIGQPLDRSVGYKKTLRAVEEELGRIVPGMRPRTRDGRLGVGVAGGMKSVGFPIAMQDSGGAMLRIGENGKFLLDVAVADLGQGSDTTMAQLAAQGLGVPLSSVSVEQVDTDIAPEAGPTVASRMTYLAGNAVVGAVQEMRAELLKQASARYDRDRRTLEITDGWIVDLRTEEEIVQVEELAKRLAERGEDLRVTHRFVESKTDQAQFPVRFNKPSDKPQDYYYASYAYATHAAVVEVNTRSGRVEVRHVIAAHDVGRAIHPQNIEGQIEGSAVMGMGTTLSESFQVDRGHVVTDTLTGCGLTRMRVAPEITSVIIEDQEPSGPFGAKGIGEVATIPTSPAILNAIYDAVGVRITDLPVSSSLIREAMSNEA
jgi:aldehyde oxidoreductase